MRDSNLRKLTTNEYFEEETRFIHENAKYINKKCSINNEEHEFIKRIGDENLSFSEKADIYFEKYKDVVRKFQSRRRYNEKKYKKYKSIYDTDFYTELNEDFIQKRIEQKQTIDVSTMMHLLQELKNRKGTYFKSGLYGEELFKLVFIGVQVDDFYYVGVNDKGEYCWHSAVSMPEFIN